MNCSHGNHGIAWTVALLPMNFQLSHIPSYIGAVAGEYIRSIVALKGLCYTQKKWYRLSREHREASLSGWKREGRRINNLEKVKDNKSVPILSSEHSDVCYTKSKIVFQKKYKNLQFQTLMGVRALIM